MAKPLKDILKGVKASKEVQNTLGGYKPKAGDEEDFAKKHTIQKWEDRAGNGDDVYNASNVKHAMASGKEARHGYKKPEDEKVNEETKCNMSEEGKYCPVHEYAACKSEKMLKEKGVKEESEVEEAWIVKEPNGKTSQHPNQKMAIKHARKVGGKVSATHGAGGKKASEVLGKKTGVSKFGPWGMREESEIEEGVVDVYAKERNDNSHKLQDWSKAKLDKHRKIPHGSHSRADIEDEHKRRIRTSEYEMRSKAPVKEEAEELEELSKKTLVSYIDKAVKDKKRDDVMYGVERGGRNADTDASRATRERMTQHSQKRHAGINMAAKKLAKEEAEELDELSKKTLGSYIKKSTAQVHKSSFLAAKDKPENSAKHGMDAYKRIEGIRKATDKLTKEEVEQVDEVLSKKAPAGEWIKDFQKSDNPKFAGKSMEKRKQMALAAYYAKQRNEDLAMPLLGSKEEKKKKGAKEQTGPDTPLTFPNMSVDVNTGRNV